MAHPYDESDSIYVEDPLDPGVLVRLKDVLQRQPEVPDATAITFTASGTGAVERSVSEELDDFAANVRRFASSTIGGGQDATDAVLKAIQYANGATSLTISNPTAGPSSSWTMSGITPIKFPAGHFQIDAGALLYPDTGNNNNPHKHIVWQGASKDKTLIEIVGDDWLIQANDIHSLHLEGLRFKGGKGVFKCLETGNNLTRRGWIVRNCAFLDHTVAAIASLNPNMPWWDIHHCEFYPAQDAWAIMLAGLIDESLITGCKFDLTQGTGASGGVKIARGGTNGTIIQGWFSGVKEGCIADIWIVPEASGSQSPGGSLGLIRTKFGNEGQQGQTYSTTPTRILIADEDTGTGTDFTDHPPSTAVSTGFVTGMSLDTVHYSSSGDFVGPLIRSYVPALQDFIIDKPRFNSLPTMVVEYPSAVISAYDKDDQHGFNIMRLDRAERVTFRGESSGNVLKYLLPTNLPPAWHVIDPLFAAPLYPGVRPGSENDDIAAVVISDAVTAPAAGSGASAAAAATDPFGGSAAWTLEFSSATGLYAISPSGTDELSGYSSRLMWLEMEIKAAGATPLTWLNYWVRRKTSSPTYNQVARAIAVPSVWRTVRIPFIPDGVGSTTGENIQIVIQPGDYSAAAKTKVDVYRPRLYVAQAPLNYGHIRTRGAGTWDGAHLIMGEIHIWRDPATDLLRAKIGAPSIASDGVQLVDLSP